jgi:hypothetical protein
MHRSGVHVAFIEFLISRLQDIVRLQPKPRWDLVPDCLASSMYGRGELAPTFTAHRQAAQVLSVHPLGVVQHVDHLAEREERIAVASRGDATDRAERVQRDEVERVATGLPARAAPGGRAALHVRVEEGCHGALQRLASAEREHQVVVRELDGRRVLCEHRRRETRGRLGC